MIKCNSPADFHRGIQTRTVYPEGPSRVEYCLSELGETMRPIIKSMEAWGTDYKQNWE
jgi:DNA-binding HxlR family transcriptional regulator